MVMLTASMLSAHAQEAYAWLSEDSKTLTFCYDGDRATREGNTYNLNENWTGTEWPKWSVENVVFEPSFADATPTTTERWFYYMSNLKKVTGIENLNTSKLERMDRMFADCGLENLDLSCLNLSNVQDMGYAFYGCSNLKSLDVSNFDISNAYTGWMFAGCTALESISISPSMGDLDDSAFTNVGTQENPCTIFVPEDACINNAIISDDYFQWKSGYFKLGNDHALGEEYVWLSEDGKILTFCYDRERATREGTTFDITFPWDGVPEWYQSSIESVIFNPLFANVKPTFTEFWFNNMFNLKEISGINYLNTSKVTTMRCMFAGCSSLNSLDLSNFDTSKCTNMYAMFAGCTSLTSLDVSNFNTSACTDMTQMFSECSSLTSLDVSSFDTSNCKDVVCMFEDCSGLTSLDVSNFDISGCSTPYGFIIQCSGLTKLSISSSMSRFSDDVCIGIGTYQNPCLIIAPEDFDFGVDTSGEYFVWKSGYFKLPTSVTPVKKEAYAVYNNGTFTFYYDELKATREGQVYSTDEADYEYGVPKWLQYNGNSFDQTLTDVTKVVFDPSYADARPTRTFNWFLDMSNLTTIEGMEYLNTSNVGDMACMFSGCGSLTSIDLSHFDTSNVFNMPQLFAYCYNLQELDLSNFDTSNVTNMNSAFVWCSSLKSINVSSFNTSKVELFMGIFARCSSLETLDVSNFDISNATGDWYGMSRTDAMFTGCSNLKNLSISSSMGNLSENACEGVGTPENPSLLIAPEGFDYGVDTSGDYFQWKTGYFMLENATPLVTLTGGDNEVPLSEYDGMTVDVELDDYTCQPDKWYSLCVPFDLSNDQLKEAFGDDANIQEMIGCTWDAENLTMSMNFNKVTEILAGKPYLLRVSGAVKDPTFEGVTINSADPLALDFGDCEMIGVLNATPLPLGDKSYLFIINNQFYYPATTNPLPAMRCYFHLLGDAAGANSVALNMEDDPNAIISVITDKAADSGLYHSLQGIATTRPHRGVYIINGKKVVVK